MDIDLYNTLLGQLVEMKYQGRLLPLFYNEPLLDERFHELMRMTKEKLPALTIVMYTNGSLLHEGTIENLIGAGVIDPKKVSRVALENAASIGGMILTTECVLSEIKDDDKGHSHGDMGGMGGMGGMM